MDNPRIPVVVEIDRKTGQIIKREGELSPADVDRLIFALAGDPRPMYTGDVPIYG